MDRIAALPCMNLLFYIHSLANGGAEKVLAWLASELAAAGHSVTLVTNTTPEQDAYPIHAAVTRRSTYTPDAARGVTDSVVNTWRRTRRLRAVASESRPDVLITFMPVANTIGGLVARLSGLAHIIGERVHPPYAQYRFGQKWLMHLAYRRSSAVTVLSEASAAWIRAHTQAPFVTVIPNAVRLPLADLQPRMNPTDFADASQRVIICVGRLVDQKQPEQVLEAFARARATHSYWVLWMIGDGPSRDALLEQARALDIEDAVRFIPRVGNLQVFYERADIYISASAFEGFPNALMEAMACGCAPISYDCPTGPAEVIASRDWGCLVSNGDVAELSAGLAALMAPGSDIAHIQQHARQVTRRYDPSDVLESWLGLLERTSSGSL
ncbi:MAG: glycosyltransferase [Pseudomonadota bacterium]